MGLYPILKLPAWWCRYEQYSVWCSMAYVTPVKDRVLSDVTPPVTAKGYFNVADWVRIYGNAQLASALAAIELGTPLAFTAVVAPTITTISPRTQLNTLLSNIETMRAAMVALIPSLVAVKYDWAAGINEDAPDYTDANLWETTIDAVWDYYDGDSLVTCPSLSEDLVIGTGEVQIFVGCVNTNGYDITINDTGVMHII